MSMSLGACANLLNLSGCVSLAGYIMMWVFRVRHAGEVCSGDFLEDGAVTDGYLVSRGKLLWVLLIISWVIMGLGLTCCCCLIAATFLKR